PPQRRALRREVAARRRRSVAPFDDRVGRASPAPRPPAHLAPARAPRAHARLRAVASDREAVTPAAELLAPAQTNLRPYEELREAGRPAEELLGARRAYDLAARLFAGQYRATGKPFVAHLVGVASIVARLGERQAVVVAALLHAAYDQGAFPGWRRAVT